MWDYSMPVDTPYSFVTIVISGDVVGVCDIEILQVTADGFAVEVPA